MLGYATRLSLVAVLIAAIIAITRRTQTPLQADQTYCYNSIKTLSSQHQDANCFTVSSSGKFTRIFLDSNDGLLEENAIHSTGNVIPGLWDSHGHVLGLGEALQEVQLYNSKSLTETLGRIHEFAVAHPHVGSKEDWMVGTGWDQAAFGRMPVSGDLESDKSLKGKYIMLFRVDAHCMWVSNTVLKLLPDPIPEIPGGEVMGKGVFCDNAMDLVMKYAPKTDTQKIVSRVKLAIKELNKVGLVGVHEAGVAPSRIRLYNELADTEDWTIRIYAMLECEKRNTFCPEDAVKIEREDGRLIVKSVKLFAGMIAESSQKGPNGLTYAHRWSTRLMGKCFA
jgi:predicted amidohydrolase YtcJ